MWAAIDPNVRRYGSVALYRGGTCFCRHTVVQGYTLWLQNYRVGKNRDAMSGSPAGGGGGLCRRLRNCPFSQGVVAAQKAMTYTALLGIGGLVLFIGYYIGFCLCIETCFLEDCKRAVVIVMLLIILI